MTDRPAKDREPAITAAIDISGSERRALLDANHSQPHRTLGTHPLIVNDVEGMVVRAFHPEAVRADCTIEGGKPVAMTPLGDGIFAAFLEGLSPPLRYRLRFEFRNGGCWEGYDAYSFLPTIGEQDQHYFNEGTHSDLWKVMGANRRVIDGIDGVSFAVWAPNAQRVSVVGDFCHFDGRVFPMRAMGASGVFELFVPGVPDGTCYKYEIKTPDGKLIQKADPFARLAEHPPKTASRVFTSSYEWGDRNWLETRVGQDLSAAPMAIYEVHLSSWARVPEQDDRWLDYREIAPRLVEHAKRFGFTHIELMPVSEYPFDGSWGYQVSGYFAPTSRHGNPDDFRYFVDLCHQNDIGVIIDWVPAHFPKDEFALRRFDGTALYEHEDPRQGEHPDWGTLIFNYGRAEVRGFLIASAVYWLEEFHIDGLRVDAVASMLYLDYSREEGQWIPNRHGGRENLEAVEFCRAVNALIAERHAGCFTVAEESTSWAGVTAPTKDGGLGFTFKWNMGWMHDTLSYFARDPVHRRFHLDELTFSMVYEQTERFIMPLSHDEVVHGKGSLLSKMPGDAWQQFANLRLLLTYMYTRPGKKLLFMGTELAPPTEWSATQSLDWHLAEDAGRSVFALFLEDLGALYLSCPPLWRRDYQSDGTEWIDFGDRDNSVLSYIRRDGNDVVMVAMNLTPVPRYDYRIGAPSSGRYRVRLSSDAARYGGSDVATVQSIQAEPVPLHGREHSLRLTLPPLAALVLVPEG